MRFLPSTALLLLLAPALPAERAIDFGREIRPILNANCVACHGGVKQQGNVSFVYREQVLAKGESGEPTVVPGDPAASALLRRISTDDPDDHMPPADHGPPLAPREIELLRSWIAQGAHWSNHWSFEAPASHPAPQVSNPAWRGNPVDPFILARLEAGGLSPAPPADPETLLRRLSLDLTGLPPTLEELDEFKVALRSPEGEERAVESTVDRLLASPHFGERWASVWQDLARYADSEGLGVDRRRDAWPYRDWIVRAFNDDLPYDQFLIKQLAGDLLPDPTLDDLLATTFHRLTQANEEGGTDNEEFRTMAVMDRVNTTWEALQGITFGCVQCHDHPYDPIRNEEYYRFLSFFNNSRDLDLNNHWPVLKVPNNPADYDTARTARQRLRDAEDAVQNPGRALAAEVSWHPVRDLSISSERSRTVVKQIDGEAEFRTEGTVATNTLMRLEIPAPADLARLTAFRLRILPPHPDTAAHSPGLGTVLSQIQLQVRAPGSKETTPVALRMIVGDEPHPALDPQQSLNKSAQGWGPYTHQSHPRWCVVILQEPLALPPGATLHLELRHNLSAINGPLATKRGRLDLTDDPRWQDWLSAPESSAAWTALQDAQKAYNTIAGPNIPIMEELPPAFRRETRAFLRGNWLEKDDKPLTPGTPASLPPLPGENPTRLDLARWIASPQNPFTARVMVNRAWEQLFGLGLVETLEDFGSAGTAPSHPELLDTLAVRFQTDLHWSFKALLRDLVLSRTYRQSPVADSASREKDPRNRLLSRGPRNRLTAEMVRDHHLAASGLLTPTLAGPPVHPPIPDGVWKPFSAGDKWTVPPVGDPQRYRRALYVYWKRSIPYPSFASFDAPPRDTCAARRLTSNTPLAALATLNDETFAEMAGGLARRMKYDTAGDLGDRLATGYRLATSRRPSPAELTELTALFHHLEQHYTAHPDLMKGMAGTPDGAAYTVLAANLLNLDAALTK